MKLKLLLCGVALLAGGCATEQNPFGYSGEFPYSYDLVPQPLPDISPSELVKIEQVQFINSPDAAYRKFRQEHNDDH
jgi:hypothetical protein